MPAAPALGCRALSTTKARRTLSAIRNRSGDLRQGFQLDDAGSGRHQDQVGSTGRGHGAVVGSAGAVDNGEFDAALAGRIQRWLQPAGLGGNHGRIVFGSPVFPFRCRGLRIEIDHRHGMAGLCGGDGKAEREMVVFPVPPFCPTSAMVNMFTPSVLQRFRCELLN